MAHDLHQPRTIADSGPLQQRLRADGLPADAAREHGQAERGGTAGEGEGRGREGQGCQKFNRKQSWYLAPLLTGGDPSPGDGGAVLGAIVAAEGGLLPGREARSLPRRRQGRPTECECGNFNVFATL